MGKSLQALVQHGMEKASISDILAKIKCKTEEIKKLVNSKVSSLWDEIQGATASATSELKKFKGQNDISWKSKGHKFSSIQCKNSWIQ
jgi:hypothetical protein